MTILTPHSEFRSPNCPLLVAAGFAGPATTAFTLECKEESLEHGKIHQQEVICTREYSRHGYNKCQRHASKTHLIEKSLRQEQSVRYIQKNNDMRREPADNLVREEQVCQKRTERVQQRKVRPQVVEIRAADTHLATELAARFLRGLLRADGACDKRAEVALLQDLRRDEEVVHDALLDRKLRVEFPADCVEGAVAADEPVEDAFELLDFGFEVPVRTFATAEHAAALVRKDQVAAGTTNLLVLERRHQLAHHVREKHRVRIAEHEDLALRDFLQAVEHRGLARVLRGLHQGDSLVGVARDNFGGAVGGSVVTDQNLELILGIVDLEDVLDFPLDDRFLVERRNQKRDIRQFEIFINLATAALEQFAHERQRHRENPVAERKQEEQHPVGDLYVK